jgi:plastocyanin
MFKINCLLALLACFATNAAFADDYTITQKNKTFLYQNRKVPSIVLKKGDTIHFKNEENDLFHNVFSLSKLMKFDLGPTGAGETKDVTFNKLGTVKVECAIHPRMVIEVVVE